MATKKKKKATKKPAKKKAAKKPAKKKPAKKKAAKKPAKKPAKKKKAAKSAKKAPPAKKATSSSANANASPNASATASADVSVPTAFPPEVAAFCEVLNSGDTGLDMEGYESFNEQYKPGDWTQNPDTNNIMATFCMDGSGGQFTFWLQPGRALLDNPVVQLGSEGELHVLATDFATFCALVATGVNMFDLNTSEALTPSEPVQQFVSSTWPGRVFPSAADILSAAQEAYPAFETWMRAQVKS